MPATVGLADVAPDGAMGAGDSPRTLRGFVALARRVVVAENAAELESLSETRGPPALARMRVADTAGGAGGRVLLALAPLTGCGLALGERELAVGDSVEIRPGSVRGVVWRITAERVIVSVDADEADDDGMGGKVELVKLVSDVTFRRQVQAMDRLEGSFRHPVADVMFEVTSPSFDEGLRGAARTHVAETAGEGMYRDALNAEQMDAICAAVAASQVALVHGPPGTGKTGTLAAAVRACVRVRGERVLACAPSNVAADNLLERIVEVDPGLRVVRVGNPARLSESVLERSLDELVADEYGGVGRQIQRDVSVVRKVLGSQGSGADKSKARATLRELRKEQRRREQDAMLFILERADVVVTTCAGAFDGKLRKMRGAGIEEDRRADNRYPFDVVFIDEAANALEPVVWCALLLGRRCVLAGDDQQLPPTVVSDDAEVRRVADGLTAFARAKRVLGNDVMLLRRQYRMHAVIAQFSSEAFYKRQLIHDESCCDRDIAGLVADRVSGVDTGKLDVFFPSDLTHCLIFIDTAGCDFFEETESGLVEEVSKLVKLRSSEKKRFKSKEKFNSVSIVEEGLRAPANRKKRAEVGSRLNEGEAGIVVAHCLNLVQNCKVSCDEIACIAPYSAQCRRIRILLDKADLPEIEVGTVDGLQGREKEVVVFSATRSSELGGKQGIGFLGETRRFNVAVSS
jgi:AAA domain